MDSLQEACLKGIRPRPPVSVQMTTWVSRIFGGMLCSEVRCMSCKHPSRTMDPFMDLSLEINRAATLERALQLFTKAELLDGDNAYKCDNCRRRSSAQKRFTVEQLPRILTSESFVPPLFLLPSPTLCHPPLLLPVRPSALLPCCPP